MEWLTGDLSYKLHEKQLEVHDSLQGDWDEALFFISRQFGKTYLGVVIAIAHCLKNPGCIVRIAAPSMKQANDIVNDAFKPICEDAPEGLIEPQKSILRWKVGSSEVRVGSLAAAHVDSLRGGNASLIICEEGGFVSSDEYQYAFRSVLVPQITNTKGKIIHITTPSQEPDHFIHSDVLKRCESRGTLFRYNVYDNPMITPEQIQSFKNLVGGEHTVEWRREYLCEVVRDASVVCIPAMKSSVICPIPVHSGGIAYCVGDIGGVRDKSVFHYSMYDTATRKIQVFKELVFDPNTPTSEMVAALKSYEREANITNVKRYLDAPGQLIIDISSSHDFQINMMLKDEWKATLNLLNIFISNELIQIDRSLHFTIKSLWSATFNSQKTDFNRTKELGHMDAIASLMYTVKVHKDEGISYSANLDEQMALKSKRFNNKLTPLTSIGDVTNRYETNTNSKFRHSFSKRSGW